ncbi:hypothetical protein C1645_837380 [Glomus cerebriforme]|uniref:Sel1 repeat protein n=1 Tax=Glomus cerebriforme TaxID=658196 RepID=A0A397S5C2_9GLOM|nr:hypothetical protein C1645_837380 [Glomus cerebriforme]
MLNENYDKTQIDEFVNSSENKLLKELNKFLLNMEICDINRLNVFINNFLFEYDLDPKNVFEIMTTIKNIKKGESNQLSFNQKNETIIFCNDEIKKLNELILLYFYSLFLYKNIILSRTFNYKLHIKNAKKGDNVSQYYIGERYYYGKNITRDYNKAIEWYSKSSEGGNILAMNRLGFCYSFGHGIKVDYKKAFEFYLKSAEGGFKYAPYNVGNCYHDGRGVFQDGSEAFEWAQYKLAEDYLNNFINKDEKKAFKDGIGIDKNLKEATKWIKKYEASKPYKKPLITINDFLNGSDINTLEISENSFVYY